MITRIIGGIGASVFVFLIPFFMDKPHIEIHRVNFLKELCSLAFFLSFLSLFCVFILALFKKVEWIWVGILTLFLGVVYIIRVIGVDIAYVNGILSLIFSGGIFYLFYLFVVTIFKKPKLFWLASLIILIGIAFAHSPFIHNERDFHEQNWAGSLIDSHGE